jgi:hypothetical protein
MEQLPDAAYLIRAKVVIGQLPRKRTSRSTVGFGSGSLCDGCERRIAAAEIEHRVDVGSETLRFHAVCAAFWEEASAMPASDIAGGSAPSAWTLVFDLRVARAAGHDRQAHDDLLSATAEARVAAARTRALSEVVRARSTELLELAGRRRARLLTSTN